MKRSFVFIFGILCSFTAFSAEDAALVAKKDQIVGFYQAYLELDNDSPTPRTSTLLGRAIFSKSLNSLIELDYSRCEERAEEGDMCGWGSSGDPFLDAQDYGPNLTFASSEFAVEIVDTDQADIKRIVVSFNLSPGSGDARSLRKIAFVAVQRKDQWLVDDVIYLRDGEAERSMVGSLFREIAGLAR